MLQMEHSAILSTFIKLPFVIKIFVLSIFEWPFYSGFTVICPNHFCFCRNGNSADPDQMAEDHISGLSRTRVRNNLNSRWFIPPSA